MGISKKGCDRMDKIIQIIENITDNYEDSDLDNYGLISEGYHCNEAEIYSTPRFINDYEVNYFSDESEVYELYNELQDELLNYNINIELFEAETEDDYHMIKITWD